VRRSIKRKLLFNIVLLVLSVLVIIWPLTMISNGDISFDRHGGSVSLLLGLIFLALLCSKSILLIIVRPFVRNNPSLKERLYSDCWTLFLGPVRK
jgi:hypothetical protein